MVVQHNLTAMNSNRMLGITTKTQSKSTEKLSSGYKINRAADDAAGLAISEKMRKQIRGLTQASLNAQDGISAVQTAEGALTEVHDMIQRMSELAVKSANGTNSQEERDYIQLEIDELINEINRVAETTKFNDIYLLKGGDGTETETVYSYKEAEEEDETYTVSYNGTLYDADGNEIDPSTIEAESVDDIDTSKYYTKLQGENQVGSTGTGSTSDESGTYSAYIETDGSGNWTVKDDLWVDDNGTLVKITADNAGDYFTELTTPGEFSLKSGYDVYSSVAVDTTSNPEASDFTVTKTTSSSSTSSVKYKGDGTLYDADGNEVDLSGIESVSDINVDDYFTELEGSSQVGSTGTNSGTDESGTYSAYIETDGSGNWTVKDDLWVDDNGTLVKITADNAGDYFAETGTNTEFYLKNGYDVYSGVKGKAGSEPDIDDFEEDDGGNDSATGVLYDEKGNKISASKLKDLFDEDGNFKSDVKVYADAEGKTQVTAANYEKYIETEKVGVLSLNLHVGAESAGTNKINLKIRSMNAKSIGVEGLDVSSEDAATAAIDELNDALRIVSEQRAKMGAIQNRLEHTINNLDNVVENTTSAESQIRDTDMATEMVRYSNNNILAQAGQAMLAQSNQANQGVLSLLG